MDNELFEKCIDLVYDHDKEWMIRHRKSDTKVIFKSLIVSAVTNVGVSSCIYGFNCDFSHVALNRARKKIDDNCFKKINMKLNESIDDHIFSIDGSKVRVHNGFKKIRIYSSDK